MPPSGMRQHHGFLPKASNVRVAKAIMSKMDPTAPRSMRMSEAAKLLHRTCNTRRCYVLYWWSGDGSRAGYPMSAAASTNHNAEISIKSYRINSEASKMHLAAATMQSATQICRERLLT